MSHTRASTLDITILPVIVYMKYNILRILPFPHPGIGKPSILSGTYTKSKTGK
jgi:hypothetical protein